MSSGKGATAPDYSNRSCRIGQNEMPSSRHVFMSDAKVSRQCRPTTLRVPPFILRLFRFSRIEFAQ